MAKQGRIYYIDTEFTDAFVAANFTYPVWFKIRGTDGKVSKTIMYDLHGVKSVSEFAEADASNISPYIQEWKNKFGIGENSFHIGQITTDATHVYLAVHSNGENSVLMNGVKYAKSTPDTFTFTAVAAGESKVLFLYALPDTQIFYLTESNSLPAGALLIATITVDENGQQVEPESYGLKYQSNDAWRTITCGNTPVVVYMGVLDNGTLRIESTTATPVINGFRTKQGKAFWDGRHITLQNKTGHDLTLLAVALPEIPNTTKLELAETYTVKKDSFATLIMRLGDGKMVLAKMGGGAEFPPGTDGQIYEIENSLPEKVKPTNRLSNAESKIENLETDLETEVVNRALADNVLSTRITANENALPSKLDKPSATDRTADNVVLGDSSTIPKRNFTRTEQIIVGANTPADESWKGKLIIVTVSCTITIPSVLSDFWGCEIATLAGVNLNLAITTPHTWLFGTPSAIGERSIITIAKRKNTNSIMLFGN